MTNPARTDRAIIAASILIFSILSIWMAFASHGFLEADAITHYLARRFAIGEPQHLVGIWSRPFCVALYAIPAKLGGLIGTRLMSLVLVMVMLAITWRVSKGLAIARPALITIFLLTQPLLFAHSFSELTEIPFATLLIAMFWAYARKQFLLLAILTAFSPLARPEGFGLMILVTIALLLHRRWWWALVLPLGLVIWSYVGWRVYGSPPDYPWYRWLRVNWPYSPDSMYGRGSPFKLIGILPIVVGPLAFPLIWIGVWRLVPFQKLRELLSDHDTRCRALIAIIPLGALVGHSLLWATGKMASNGEPRYMLIVAPFWAMLAAAGWEWVIQRCKLHHPYRVLVLAALIPLIANIIYPVFPLKTQDDDRLSGDVRQWLEQNPQTRERYPLIAGALPHLFLQMDLDRLDKSRSVDSSRTVVQRPLPGILMVWDSVYSGWNSNAEYCITEQSLIENGWTPIASFTRGTNHGKIYLSPLNRDGQRTAPSSP